MLEGIFITAALVVRILANPLGNVFQKTLTTRGHHPLLVNFLTYLLLGLVCVVPAYGLAWGTLSPDFWLYSLLGGAVGALGNGFLVKALQKGDLSVLGPINAYKAVIGMLGGVLFLGEVPGLWGLAGVALIIYGSYFVLETTGEGFSWVLLRRSEIRFRLLAMLLTAIEAVFVKKVVLASSVAVAFMGWCWFGALFSGLILLVFRVNLRQEMQKLSFRDSPPYLMLIVCVGLMQFTTNYVFDHLPVGYALSLFQLSTLVSVWFGYRLFQETHIQKKLLGSVIMLVGSVIVILFKE
ncbi:hypothetical protein GCM10027275_11280 [Rhabdobacter roseus]|uniref:Drug/metabolite transporter (DMT)-like permease n=1 Tax=Rhabdobacter roseus TaxID=1655419 RepID=A0A840TTM6_9BACT|nr:EamA family transporter [Rhabdobacter roseus]MBB5283039.1 drug/metabolite transporter (DMT)-like permease [Rhabdobacter roseus]